MKQVNLIIGNDNGNSEHDLVINGKMIAQPNVYCQILKLPNLEELNKNYLLKDLHSNLIVTIESPCIDRAAKTYYIGNYACKSGRSLKNIMVGADNSKINSLVPIVNTLGQIAASAVTEFPDEAELEVAVDMTTALPVTQYSKAAAKAFSSKFLNSKHRVVVHLGEDTVTTTISFNYVKVLPEGVPTVFFLQSIEKKLKDFDKKRIGLKGAELAELEEEHKVCTEILSEYMQEYNLKVADIDFTDKKILHVAIGEGTTEYPLTEGISFNPNFIKGTNNGVGHAINAILEDFKKDKSLIKLARQDYSNILKNKAHKYHDEAIEWVMAPLEDQADVILDNVKQEVVKANNEIDIICVYGGGSILMREFLYEQVKQYAKATQIKVLYMPEPYSVIAEAQGMYEFAKSPMFNKLKEMYIEHTQNEK